MVGKRVERNLMIGLEGHIGCKIERVRKKTRYNDATGMSGSESISSLLGQKTQGWDAQRIGMPVRVRKNQSGCSNGPCKGCESQMGIIADYARLPII